MIFLLSIAKQEGMFAAIGPKGPNRPQHNNNPGDLEFHGWESIYGGVKGSDPRFAQFKTVEDGYLALRHLFTFPIYFNKKLSVVFNTYAPPGENATNVYLANVCHDTGCTPDTILTMDLLTLPQ
jgi:hypothetical protein